LPDLLPLNEHGAARHLAWSAVACSVQNRGREL
jgi:hypothetical protein